jgi:hypothetical protein
LKGGGKRQFALSAKLAAQIATRLVGQKNTDRTVNAGPKYGAPISQRTVILLLNSGFFQVRQFTG